MITGRRGGSGKYSFHKRDSGLGSVMVAHMPEDSMNIRIIISHMEETDNRIIKLSESHAEMLWAALNSMAQDLKWEDFK